MTITSEDTATLNTLIKMSEVLEKLQDKEVMEEFASGALSKLQVAKRLTKEANATAETANKELRAANLALRKAEEISVKTKEDKLTIENATVDLRVKEAEFSAHAKAKTEDLHAREKLAEGSIKDATKATTRAAEAEEKFNTLSVELEEKLSKLKAATA
jgi:hypothetical protein